MYKVTRTHIETGNVTVYNDVIDIVGCVVPTHLLLELEEDKKSKMLEVAGYDIDIEEVEEW